MKTTNRIILLIVLCFLSGCTVGPDYSSPAMDMSSGWPGSAKSVFLESPDANKPGWWKVFSDGDLDNLIEIAIANNRDVRASAYRVEASRASRDYTSGQYWPDINAEGSQIRSQASKDGAVQTAKEPDPKTVNSGGFDFMWEIDLFGRIRRSVESARASYQASIEDYHDVMVTLLAEVCRNYIELRTAQMRIAYAQDNIKIQQDTLGLTKSRYEAEIAGELDVRQAELNLANTQAEIPSLRIAEAAAINRLAVLLGKMPGAIREQLSQAKPLPYSKIETQNLASLPMPADMLRQRPDIRRAERRLAAQTAQIGVATADLYPSLELSGTFEIQSRRMSGLGNIHNKAYSFGPNLQWNLFDANRIKNTIKMEKAGTQELLANWENTVLSAAEDVENAITSYAQQKQRKESLDNSVKASLRSLELVENLYKNGLTDFQNVLDTQRTLFTQQDKLADSQGQVLQALVRVYKGFGCGWQNSANALRLETAKETSITKK
jgi:multidrug efflux system outer membrane protein